MAVRYKNDGNFTDTITMWFRSESESAKNKIIYWYFDILKN